MAPREKKERKTRSALSDVVTREYTIHLHKHVHGLGFKKVRSSSIPFLHLSCGSPFGSYLPSLI